MTKTSSWPGDHVIDLDLRSLAVARIGIGLVLLVDTLIRWTDTTAHYSDYGVLPRSTLLEYGWNTNFLSLHMVSGEPRWLHLLFLLQAAASVALVLGYRTRPATFVSWLLLISVHNRNPWILNGGDVYLRVILLWALFLPWEAKWSLDRRQGRWKSWWWVPEPSWEKGSVRSLLGAGLLLQVCLLYWFAALPKSHPSWVADYSAIDIALRLDQLVTPFGIYFRETFADFLAPLTKAIFYFEVWGPFLLWFPFDRGQLRTLTLFGFMGMHVGFEATMELGVFPAACFVVLPILLPGWFWEVPAARLTHFLDRKLSYPSPQQAVDKGKHLSRFREVLFASLICYTLSWNFGNEQFRPALWFPDSLDWIGYTLRLDQRWNMFSPSPPYQDGWWVVRGRRRSGEIINALEPSAKVDWSKPECIARTYKNQRRRRWMMELRSTNSAILMHAYCSYLCRTLNGSKNSLHGVSEIKLHYMVEQTDRDGTEHPATQVQLYHHYCFQNVPRANTDW